MMAIHESGHALAAWISGGKVQRVILPACGFSRTDVSPNPYPSLEVWAGPIWGSFVPLIIFSIARRPWWMWRFFTGFCLIANGGYLAAGWKLREADAGQLIRLGVPVWLLISVGAIGIGLGLYIWHRMGFDDNVGRGGSEVASRFRGG